MGIKSPSATSDPRRLISMADAAFYAGVSVQTIRRRVADGTLSAYRFGPRSVRIDRDQLLDQLIIDNAS